MFTLDGSHVTVLIAFIAGFMTFFASCLLPLVPTYLAYLSGVSLSSAEAVAQRGKILKVSIVFVVGFIMTFMMMGLAVNKLNGLALLYRDLLQKIAGTLFIFLGLHMVGLLKSQVVLKERRINLDRIFVRYTYVHAFLTGVGFAAAWTPCIGPVLAVILYWSAQQTSLASGIGLLFIYGLGLGLPFVAVAMAFEQLMPWMKKTAVFGRRVSQLAGLFIIVAGLLMVSGHFQVIGLYVTKLLGFRGLTV